MSPRKKQFKIIRNEREIRLGHCSKCGKLSRLAKVVNLKTGEVEWRCREHIRYLKDNKALSKNNKDRSHILAQKNIEDMKRQLKTKEDLNRLR